MKKEILNRQRQSRSQRENTRHMKSGEQTQEHDTQKAPDGIRQIFMFTRANEQLKDKCTQEKGGRKADNDRKWIVKQFVLMWSINFST